MKVYHGYIKVKLFGNTSIMLTHVLVSYNLDCGNPTPTHGLALVPEGTAYGVTAFVTCDEGFTLVGSGYISCGDDGSWSSNTTCIIKGTTLHIHVY